MTSVADDWSIILDSILEGFQVVDAQFRYVHLNATAAAQGRSTKGALLGRTMMECYPGIENTEMFTHLRRCLVERTPHLMENVFTFPDGSQGHFELRIEPVPQGACVLSMDVTARKRAEQAQAQAEERLRQAQRMEAVGQLAAGIAHDFNNLLTVMLGYGEMALLRPEGPQREDVETMLVAARSSADVTRQLLAYGRRSVAKRAVINVATTILQLEHILRHALGARIDLRLDLSTPVCRVEFDPAHLQQIVMNLVINARDAIADRGQITVSLESVDLDDDHLRQHPEAHRGLHTVLVVTDTGSGMDTETCKHIFEPFFTTKPVGNGTGLGLATVYGIVKQSDGNVTVNSAPGRGSTFKVFLPATDRLPSVSAPAVRAPSEAHGGTVLVVDDAPLLRQLMELSLTRAGFHVVLANDGESALSLWQTNRDQIDAVVTDMMMPGMTGTELIHHLRASRPSLPIICTSGHGSAEMAGRQSMPMGVVYVEKPFKPSVLVQEVRALLTAV